MSDKHESCVAWEDHNETLDELQKCREQLGAEREVGGNTAIALAQQITKLEDQLAAEREKVKKLQLLVQDLGNLYELTDEEWKLAGKQ